MPTLVTPATPEMMKWSLPASTMVARSGVSPLAACATGIGRIASAGEARGAGKVRAIRRPIRSATVRLRRMLLPLEDDARVCRRDINPATPPLGTTRSDYMATAPDVLRVGPSDGGVSCW